MSSRDSEGLPGWLYAAFILSVIIMCMVGVWDLIGTTP